MNYKELAADLLSGCEENCADCEYSGGGEFDCTITQLAAKAITDLLARAEAAEAREKNLIEAVQMITARAEKAENERDSLRATLRQLTEYGQKGE